MVTIDCVDPQSLAKFWTEAAGYSVASDWGEFVVLAPGADGSPAGGARSGGLPSGGLRLGLQKVSESRAGKNRVHLDWHTPDRAAEVGRLVGLGAAVIGEHHVPGLSWTVLTDPEGNEFCVGESSAPPASEAGSVA
jgi:predicted enzyme related to lactoylglutathione lyase